MRYRTISLKTNTLGFTLIYFYYRNIKFCNAITLFILKCDITSSLLAAIFYIKRYDFVFVLQLQFISLN